MPLVNPWTVQELRIEERVRAAAMAKGAGPGRDNAAATYDAATGTLKYPFRLGVSGLGGADGLAPTRES